MLEGRAARGGPGLRALLLAVLMTACSSSSEPNGKEDSGAGGDAGPDAAPPADPTLCMQAVRQFCERSCSCTNQPPSCVTGNPSPSGSGVVALTWSDAADCEGAYFADWCRGGSQAPVSIEACASAVATLECGGGGVTRPESCNPGPEPDGRVACTTDAECPGSHCAKPHRAGTSIRDLEPLDSGHCARECRTTDTTHVYCGSSCSPGIGMYCMSGWSCVGGLGASEPECQCSVDERHPERSMEICDGQDNDCNGVVDDHAAADASCGRAGEGCEDGSCRPCNMRCDGRCVDTDLDAANCGGCGNTCGAGQACAGGSCVASHAVVQGRGIIEALFAFRGDAYFVERYVHGVQRCPAAGCTTEPARITPDEWTEFVALPAEDDAAADPELAFLQRFVDNADGGKTKHRVQVCPISGCGDAPTLLGEVELLPTVVSVRSGSVFMGVVEGDAEPGIYVCGSAGCEVPPTRLNPQLTTSEEPTFATDASYLYFTLPSRAGVFRCPLAGPCDTASPVFEGGYRTTLIGVDQGFVYVNHQTANNNRNVARCPVEGCAFPENLSDAYLAADVHDGQLFTSRGDLNSVILQCPVDDCSAPKRIWRGTDEAVKLYGFVASDGVLFLNLAGEDARTGGTIWAVSR